MLGPSGVGAGAPGRKVTGGVVVLGVSAAAGRTDPAKLRTPTTTTAAHPPRHTQRWPEPVTTALRLGGR